MHERSLKPKTPNSRHLARGRSLASQGMPCVTSRRMRSNVLFVWFARGCLFAAMRGYCVAAYDVCCAVLFVASAGFALYAEGARGNLR